MITSALDPRRAITEQGIVCLICGREFRHLTNTHLRRHGLTSAEYKEHFGYNRRQERDRCPARRFFVRDGRGRFASASAPRDLALLASG